MKNTQVDNTISPKMIREMLNIDNAQIQKMCKTASIKPKKNSKGITYFTKDDVEIMKNLSGSKSDTLQSKLAMLKSQTASSNPIATQPEAKMAIKLVESLNNLEKSLTDKISSIMDEKLDGMDDVVVELIRCKTENETLRYKINELNKENYNLKNELSSFKNVALNLYMKKPTSN